MEHCHANNVTRVRRDVFYAARSKRKRNVRRIGHPARFAKDLSRKRNWEMSD